MWEVEKFGQVEHVLKIGDNIDSLNNWILFITVLTSVFEAVMLPLFICIIWIFLYQRTNHEIHANEFRLYMEATYGSILEVLKNVRFGLSMNTIVFVILFLMATILGKNIPNVLLSKVIKAYNFTTITPSNIVLFNNDLNCSYSSCITGLENNFALVLNSTQIQDVMHENHVKHTYWDSNNILYAVRFKTNSMSCSLSMGSSLSGLQVTSDVDLEIISRNFSTPPGGGCSFTQTYSPNYLKHTITMEHLEFKRTLIIEIEDRCDICMNMFYISPDFSPNVLKLAKWLNDRGCTTERKDWGNPRACAVRMVCDDTSVEWQKMQIFGNTPDETKISEVNFDNSTDQLYELFKTHVRDTTNYNGRVFGEQLIDNALHKMNIIYLEWRIAVNKGSQYNSNLLDKYDTLLSQSLASSIQSIKNNVTVNVDEANTELAPGLWIEFAIISSILFLICGILSLILTTNKKLLQPLSVTDVGIISKGIFEDVDKKTWPFVENQGSKGFISANQSFQLLPKTEDK